MQGSRRTGKGLEPPAAAHCDALCICLFAILSFGANLSPSSVPKQLPLLRWRVLDDDLNCFTSLCCCVRTEEHALVGYETRLFPLILTLAFPLSLSVSLYSPPPTTTRPSLAPNARARVLPAKLAPRRSISRPTTTTRPPKRRYPPANPRNLSW